MHLILMATTGRSLRDGTHRSFLLTHAVGMRQRFERLVLFVGQPQRHCHECMVPKWYQSFRR